jgi:hypothetical protein
MQGRLSPLMLMAGQGLLENAGLGINTTLQSAISAYKSNATVSAYQDVIDATYVTDACFTFANDTCPALTNAVPDSYTALSPAQDEIIDSDGSTVLQPARPAGWERFTDVLEAHANNILGNGDLSKFVVQMFTSLSYVTTSAEFIDGAVTANDYLAVTFDDFDNLVTGNISGVSLALEEFGQDLYNTGKAIDLTDLQHYGTPHALISVLADAGILEYISPELVQQGVNPEAVRTRLLNLADDEELRLVVQKKCYDAFKTITGDKLDVIKAVLRVRSTEVVTLADMLNTFKMFPVSRQTLTSITRDGYRGIFVNATGSVNEKFKGLGKAYYSVMPADICDANAAFKRSLQQVKNIAEMTSESLGLAVQELETNYGLADVNALAQPLPSDTYSYYTSSFAGGSGTNGRYYLSDFVGTPAGIVHNEEFSKVNAALDYLDSQNALDSITTDFNNLATFLNTAMDGSTSVSIPGYGSYTDHDTGVTAVLSGVATKIATLTSNYPTYVATLNTSFDAMAAQITAELSNLTAAGVDFEDTPSNKASTMSLVQNLHSYATQNDYRGVAEMLEKMANTTTRAGQALVGALREGRNLATLASTGVGTDALPHEVTQPTDSADISPGKYSLTEALNSVILD